MKENSRIGEIVQKSGRNGAGNKYKIFTNFVVIFLIGQALLAGNQKYSPEIEKYVNFLNTIEEKTAREYILSLWKDKSLVVLCERDHNDLTQYDLIYDVVSSEYFINNAGNVFIEVGSVSVQDQLLAFLETSYATEKDREDALIRIYRNFTWPIWEKSNTYFFLLKINMLNDSLSLEHKIKVFTVDEPTPPLKSINSATDYKEFEDKYQNRDRDTVMAENVIARFDRFRETKPDSKGLVIMNYRHAFMKNIVNPSLDTEITNTGALLNDHYKNNLASVYINYVPWGGKSVPIQNGKWDAAFKVSGKEDIGFDLKDSPFGRDFFDLWPYSSPTDTYADYFTGIVYYLPLNKHVMATGLDNFLDAEFEDELYKRISIFCEITGREPFGKEAMKELLKYKERHYSNNDKFMADINKWIIEK